MKRRNLLKIMLSVVLTLAMLCSASISTFAAEVDDGNVMTYGYNPNASTNSSGARSIIGDDDRSIVDNTDDYPYSAIAYLSITYSCGCGATGTGFMVSANCMLTAGHCIVCTDHGNTASSITAWFGYESNSSYLLKKTATSSDSVFYHDPEYTGSEKNYDYGYVVFNSNVGNTTGWFGLASRNDSTLDGMSVTVSGYRYGIMYKGTGEITSVANKRLKYDVDTEPGQSGSPVYIYGSEHGYQAVAIHTHGTNLLNWKNSGWRITSDFINHLADLGYVTKAS